MGDRARIGRVRKNRLGPQCCGAVQSLIDRGLLFCSALNKCRCLLFCSELNKCR